MCAGEKERPGEQARERRDEGRMRLKERKTLTLMRRNGF